ncbi:MBL fold metallo-hydrolase [Thetidibacter halocola]|uniref:MBL fold metallo-hydrolase n=1 Tax=Thetidibacter halocola TaxID=2827239 RepID=A0A8J8B736_9RHOB|nr:MBL fold metallo-hydrolase [Thetidibacter halocola]MBS0124007.1 MBL fold metallo-hydrolase [Thetidibacter halocola]
MSTERVVLLGTKGGPAIRPGSPMPTATLLQLGGATVLIDAGLGAARGLCDAGVALTALDAIVITHLHSDHYLELGPLLHTAWTAGLKRPVPVIGPEGLATYWQGFLASMDFDIALRQRDEGRPPLAPLADIRVIGEDQAIGPLALRAMRNVHPPIEDSYALRVDHAGRAVVISGDTAPMPEMVDFARGADVLVHEAMLEAGIDALCARVGNGDDRLRVHLERSHSPAGAVARIASEAGVGQLALNHMIPVDDPAFGPADWEAAIRPHWPGPLTLGGDGAEIPLPAAAKAA